MREALVIVHADLPFLDQYDVCHKYMQKTLSLEAGRSIDKGIPVLFLDTQKRRIPAFLNSFNGSMVQVSPSKHSINGRYAHVSQYFAMKKHLVESGIEDAVVGGLYHDSCVSSAREWISGNQGYFPAELFSQWFSMPLEYAHHIAQMRISSSVSGKLTDLFSRFIGKEKGSKERLMEFASGKRTLVELSDLAEYKHYCRHGRFSD